VDVKYERLTGYVSLRNRRQNIFFMVISPTPGTFVIALHFKGRDKPILEMDLKIDDLLEKVRSGLGMRRLC
jgi:Ras GTPase-activating-like protein IQGAP2/3